MHDDLVTCLDKDRLNEPVRKLKYSEGILDDNSVVTNSSDIDNSLVSQIKDDTEEKKMVTIQNPDGSLMDVEVVTYLISDDQINKYLVYTKGELSGSENDVVIYVSKIIKKDSVLTLEEITDDKEWSNVQTLLKRIANA